MLIVMAELGQMYLRNAVIAISALEIYEISSCLGIASNITKRTLIGNIPI